VLLAVIRLPIDTSIRFAGRLCREYGSAIGKAARRAPAIGTSWRCIASHVDRLLAVAPKVEDSSAVACFCRAKTKVRKHHFNLLKAVDWSASNARAFSNMQFFAVPAESALRTMPRQAYRTGIVLIAAVGHVRSAFTPLYPSADPSSSVWTATECRRQTAAAGNRGPQRPIAARRGSFSAPAPAAASYHVRYSLVAAAHASGVSDCCWRRSRHSASDCGVFGRYGAHNIVGQKTR